MKNSLKTSLVLLSAISALSGGAALGQINVNGTNEGATYDLGTSNQVAGPNGYIQMSSGTLTQSAPNALIGTGAVSAYQYPYQFAYQIAGGTVTLSQSNLNFDAPIAFTGGTINAEATGALGSSAIDMFYGNGVLNLDATNALTGTGSITETYQFQNFQINVTAPQNYSGATTLAAWNQNAGGVNMTISGAGNLSNTAITLNGPNNTLSLQTTNAITGGSLTFFSGGATLTEGAANAISGTTSLINTAAAGTAISAANNYTGTTTVIGGSNPFTAGTGNETYIREGGLVLDFGQSNSPADNIVNNGITHANIGSGSSLVLDGGSIYAVGGHALANTQEFNGAALNTGNSTITADGGGSGGTMSLALNGITRQIGGLANFNLNADAPSGAGAATITTTNTNADFTGGQQTILGGWAVVGGSTWATVGSDGSISGLSNYSELTRGSESASQGMDVDAGGYNNEVSGLSAINSLRFDNSSLGADLYLDNDLVIATGGILVTPSSNTNGELIEGGVNLTSGNGQDLIVTNNGAPLTISDNIVDNGGSIGLTLGGNAGASLILSGTNTFTGQLTINSGTLTLASEDALDGTPNLVFGSDGQVNSGNLSLNGNNATVSGLGQAAGQGYAINGGMNVYNGSSTTEATLTVDNATNDSFAGGISDNPNGNPGPSLNFVKDGAGELDLTTSIYNNNNRVTIGYTGTTTVNEGRLYLAASSGSTYMTNTSIVSVNGGGSIGGGNLVTIGHAYTDGPTTNATGEFEGVQVAGGSTAATQGSIDLRDGSSNVFRIAQDAGQTGLYIGGATGNPGAINLDVGYNPITGYNADAINLQYMSSYYTSGNTVNSGNIYIAPGGFQVDLNGLGTLQGGGPINIMQVSGFDTTSTGFGGNTFGNGYDNFADAITAGAISLGSTTGNFNGYVVTLGSGSDTNGYELQLTETANPTPTVAYFSGANGASGNAWNTFTGGNANNSNWTSSDGGADTNQTPGAQTDVFFGTAPTAPAALANYLNNTLGTDLTINSLQFTGNSTGNVTIGGSDHFLTINAGGSGNNTSGNGITVAAGAGAETIQANVNLGSSQTWTNNSSHPLTVSGDILDHDLSGNNMNTSHGYSLTKAGSGALVLSGTNSYSGGTTVATGELDAMNVAGSATGSGSVMVNDLATLAGKGIIAPTAGNNVEIATGATLSPGLLGSGALTFNMSGASALDFDAGSTLALTLGTSSTDVAFTNLGAYLGGSGNATLALNLGAGFNYADTYTVFSNTSSPLYAFNSITGYDSTEYTAMLANIGGDEVISFQPTGVPEPSEYVLMLAGFGVLAFLYRRKATLSAVRI